MSWQHFSEVNRVGNLHSKCGSELTFEKCCQEAATCPELRELATEAVMWQV